jgi:hypothetical protein
MKRSLLAAIAITLALSPAARAQGFFSDVAYTLNIGVGGSAIVKPDEFEQNYNPAFGLLLDVGAQKGWIEASIDFDFSFFLAEGSEPNDINIFNTFLVFKIKPLESKARPYILAGGGYYRFWIVDLNIYENTTGYVGGAGLELEINRKQRLFIEGRYLSGRTRETPDKVNVQTIPIRVGLTWVFQ